MKEEWRDIKDYEGKYQVSNLGRVRSLRDNHGNYRIQFLSLKPNEKGYISVNLYKHSKKKGKRVNRLVAEAFIPNPNNYGEVNHKDENKSNNHVSNLEWCTSKYNTNYGTRNKKLSEKLSGENNPMYGKTSSKNPSSRKVRCITTGKKFNCIKEAAEYYYVCRQHISKVCNGKLKSAGKHPVTGEKLIWRYL